jgi:LacI family transcriptional regulator
MQICNLIRSCVMEQAADKTRPTLRSIAYLTGLGVSTVSRALKDDAEIAADTRARVKLTAQQIGYRPNRAGVRLRTGKTHVITLALNARDAGAGFFSDFVYGVIDALSGTPYHLVITPYSLSGDPMEPIRYIVETGAADGVIISRIEPDDGRVRYLAEHHMPFATHGRTDMGLVHPHYDFDNDAFALLALKKLKARGRSRIALLGPPPGLTYHTHTHQGFERGLQQLGLVGVPMGSTHIDMPLDQIREAGRSLAQRVQRADGIVCSGINAAIALAAGLSDAGLVTGRDYDMVAKQTTNLAALLNPDIIVVDEDLRAAGHDVAKMVLAAINGVAPDTLQKLIGPG